MSVALEDSDRAALAGDAGPAGNLAMRVLVRAAEAVGAAGLLDISGAHIDSCLYHGRAGLDFATRLAADDARVCVPTTLNVASLDLRHPDLYRGDPETARLARVLTEKYEQMGCTPTWTCAPYQLLGRPGFGEHVAWAESNAIVFANSVLGARTARYGDFIDICAAITGRAPAAGLHLDVNRLGTAVFDVTSIGPELLELDATYPVLGHLIGKATRSDVPVIVGLPNGMSEDRLKALGAAAASSGSVAMFHVVGCTPEAPDLNTALGGRKARVTIELRVSDLRAARDQLTTAHGNSTETICVGTPHYSVTEFAKLVELFGSRRLADGMRFYATTGREVLAEIQVRGWDKSLLGAGVTIITDTCTYITPLIGQRDGAVMTDSAKWAYYAPGNIGVEVIFGSTEDCVETAIAGQLVRDETVWGHD